MSRRQLLIDVKPELGDEPTDMLSPLKSMQPLLLGKSNSKLYRQNSGPKTPKTHNSLSTKYTPRGTPKTVETVIPFITEPAVWT
jgi:hypothetical protein